MKFTTVTTPLCSLVILTSFFVSALPLSRRDVFIPNILSPVLGDQWPIKTNQTVTWNVTSPPDNITNRNGKLSLMKGDRILPVTLATFDIMAGSVNVTVPNVDPGDDYRVVLFGDSGNWSPAFSIVTGDPDAASDEDR